MRAHKLAFLLITHRKWAPMQTRPAWPAQPRMEFQSLNMSFCAFSLVSLVLPNVVHLCVVFDSLSFSLLANSQGQFGVLVLS